MKRVLVISEEFGLYRIEGSNGEAVTGPSVPEALAKFAARSGVIFPYSVTMGGMFEECLPKTERPDGPAAA